MKAAARSRPVSRHERGSALVEFAIVSTLALTIILGIVDFGRALYTFHLVSNAARAGTRYAIVRGSTCGVAGCPASASDVQTFVRGLAPGIDPSALAVATTWPNNAGCTGPANAPGCVVSVQVTYQFSFLVPLLPRFTMPMTSTSQMVISQ